MVIEQVWTFGNEQWISEDDIWHNIKGKEYQPFTSSPHQYSIFLCLRKPRWSQNSNNWAIFAKLTNGSGVKWSSSDLLFKCLRGIGERFLMFLFVTLVWVFIESVALFRSKKKKNQKNRMVIYLTAKGKKYANRRDTTSPRIIWLYFWYVFGKVLHYRMKHGSLLIGIHYKTYGILATCFQQWH